MIDRKTLEALFSVSYEELCRLGPSLRRSDQNAGLSPTALANEAWLKLAHRPDSKRCGCISQIAEGWKVRRRERRTRNQDKVSDATNNIADACSSCHEVYRDKGPADSPVRCTPPAKK